MSDSMVGYQKFRTFNVIDDCTREVLAIEADTSLSSRRITRTLERFIEQRGIPTAIRTDNCPEFISSHIEAWCSDRKIAIQFIQPSKPMQYGYIERFSRLYRETVLEAYLFFIRTR